MAQQSYPFDAGAGAAVNEAQWQAMARRFRQTGVIEGSLSQLAVTADGSALSVSVATGDAFVEGFFYRNDSALALTIATANATNPRIDTVVVRLDRVANTATLAVVTGTAAASPVAPTLSTADSLYELPLANVTVPAAAGVIVAGNVADRRTLTKTFDSAAYAPKAARGVSAFRTTAFPLSPSTYTAVPLTSENYDTHSYHDNAVNPTRLTIPADGAGLYLMTAFAYFGNVEAGTAFELALRTNGGSQIMLAHDVISKTGGFTALSSTEPIRAVPGDYFELLAFHTDATSSRNVAVARFGLTYVGT